MKSLILNSFYFYYGSFSGLFRYFTGYFSILKRKYKLTGLTTL
jgi:hypothetical protein